MKKGTLEATWPTQCENDFEPFDYPKKDTGTRVFLGLKPPRSFCLGGNQKMDTSRMRLEVQTFGEAGGQGLPLEVVAFTCMYRKREEWGTTYAHMCDHIYTYIYISIFMHGVTTYIYICIYIHIYMYVHIQARYMYDLLIWYCSMSWSSTLNISPFASGPLF